MSKFRVGDRVTITKGRLGLGESGVIMEISGYYSEDIKPEHHVMLDGERETRVYFEDGMEYENTLGQEIYESNESTESTYYESISYYATKHTSTVKKPKFKIGDVVIDAINEQCPVYIIKDITTLIDGHDIAGYSYEVAPFGSPDESITITEDTTDLVLEYHDTNWEEYFTEGTRQRSLPQWRGELYNFYVFYNDFGPNKELDYKSMEEYNNDTIPPMFMKHILDEHSIFKRIDVVLDNEENVSKIMADMNINESKLDNLVNSIKNKINRRNLSDMDPSVKKEWEGSSKKFDFTGDELNLVSEIDKLDEVTENHVRIIKDHYPVDMTNLQIMKAIKDAYDNAHDMKGVIMQDVKDWRTVKKVGGSKPTVVKPVKGKRKYRGVAKNGLTIEIWYNFDLDLIESAYPLRMNNNVKKH